VIDVAAWCRRGSHKPDEKVRFFPTSPKIVLDLDNESVYKELVRQWISGTRLRVTTINKLKWAASVMEAKAEKPER
jgi:hypothetical protein